MGLFISIYLLWLEKKNRQPNKHFTVEFLKAASIPSFRDSILPINSELSRARRFEKSVSVIVIKYNSFEENLEQKNTQADASIVANIFSRHKNKEISWANFLQCGIAVRDALRDIDLICFAGASYQYVIVLPETTRANAELLHKRLLDIVGSDISNQFDVGISEFPNDGLIIDDLVGSATDSINEEFVAQH